MSLNLSVPNSPTDLKPRIVVFGVGGAGGNAVNNMIRSNLEGVECAVANTDAQALAQAHAERRIQLGRNITQGLGAGSRPDIGRAAAEEGIDELLAELEGVHMVFIAAGMGGGTGTGASPVIARASRDHGILTVGVVTKPFHFEGPHRMRIAEEGIEELQRQVDTLIVIPNQNLFRVATEKTTFADAFKMADHVLYSGVRGVTDLMVMPGLINLDFADIRTVMSEMGKAMMGAGEANGEDRARAAAEQAINNPLLDDVSMKGARGVLINITGGPDMTLYEVDEAVNRIRDEVDPNANLIFGSTFDESLDGELRVSVFATGIDSEAAASAPPPRSTIGQKIRLVSDQDTSGEAGYAAAAAVAAAGEVASEPLGAFESAAAAPDAPAAAETAALDDEAALAEASDAGAVASAAEDVVREREPEAGGEDLGDALQELAGEPIPFDDSDLRGAATFESEQSERGLVERVSAAREELERALRDEAKAPQHEEPEPRHETRDSRHETRGSLPESKEPRPESKESRYVDKEPRHESRGLRQQGKGPDTIAPFPRVDANDRIPQSEDEDLLEIPAFLRRQAN